ncbi:MAG: 4-hydroxy-tetrahydrodipicolinate synthase [Candidatus Sumerlaeota bacterium]|nr:4-hydroxy-tetrahydrodipicolinate synthase [Candidatus Sumerlaeota bacterium]
MITSRDLRGCYPALITPMRLEEGKCVVDHDAFHKQIAYVIDHGVTGIVIAGTTGQSATLTHEEQIELVNDGALYAKGYANGRGRDVQIIAAAGSNSTAEAVYMSREILARGRVDALLHVSGYYNNPPQEGLIRHFSLMAELAVENHAAVILYNVPSRTGSNLDAASCIELAQHPGIIGVKEASGNIEQVQEILDNTDPDKFAVVSGEDHMVAEIVKRGGQGVISASANRWPREFQTLCDLALAGEHEKAAELQAALLPCVDAVFSVKNPIPLHYMLGADLRAPLVRVDELREPKRGQVIGKISKALALKQFPHVEVASDVPEYA